MQITDPAQVQLSKAPVEYTVYGYNKYCGETIGYNKWKCLLSGDDKSEVLEAAEKFFDTDKFQKIEVKKKSFNTKKERHLVSTLCVLDDSPKKSFLLMATTATLILLSMSLVLLEVL